MSDILKVILIAIGFLNLASLACSFVLFYTNRGTKGYKLNFYYWSTMSLTFIVQGIFSEGRIGIIVSYCTSSFFILVLDRILINVFEPKVDLYRTHLMFLTFGSISSVILSFLPVSFTLASIPVSFSIAIVMWSMCYNAYTKSSNRVSATGKLLLLIIFVGAFHMADFPFLRMVDSLAAFGFSAAFAYVFFMSIMVPYVIAENTQIQYTTKLENEVEQKTAKLKQINNHLDDLAQERQDLVRMICHDLNNHIMITGFFVDFVESKVSKGENPGLADRFNKHLKSCRRALSLQTELTRNVALMSSVETGKTVIQNSSVSLIKALETSLESVENRRLQKNITIKLKCESEFLIYADEGFLCTTVFNNILTNSIKFSDKDQTIKIRAVKKQERIYVFFLDRGIGIPEDLQRNLFSKQVKTNRVGTNGEKGTGFGMPLILSMLERFDAKIKVKSRSREDFGDNSMTLICIDFKCPVNASTSEKQIAA